jgi:hypothetical protein
VSPTRTVYFDTGFYRELAALAGEEAARVVAALDDLSIRTVLSPVVLEELLLDDLPPERGRALAQTLLFLDQRSLCLASELSWAMLGLEAGERRALLGLYRRVGPLQALGDALSLLPRSEATAEQRKKLQAQLNRKIAQLGFDSLQGFGDARLGWLLDAATPVLRKAGVELGGLELTGLGRASSVKLRDIRRLAELLRCAGEIDLFQLDRAQLDGLERQGAEHPVIAAGLLGRCFCSEPGRPLEALAEVRRRLGPG